MTITLTPPQIEWLNARVARGDYASLEEAARQLIDERIAEAEFEDDDLAWAKPLVDEALEEVARGNVLSLEEHEAKMQALIDSLER